MLSCIAGAIYVFINIFTGYYYIAAAQTAFVLVCAWFYKTTDITSTKKQTQTTAKIYLAILYISLLFVFSKEDVPKSVYIWALLTPFLSYLLLGRLWGAIYTALFTGVTAALYLYMFNDQEQMMNAGFLSNLISCTLIAWVLANEYELLSKRTQSDLVDIASHDDLTGLYNRTQLKTIFYRELINSKHSDKNLSIIVLDIDWFKKVNDTYGHASGDKVLILIADLIRLSIRSGDSAFRIGGEEFCVILPSTAITSAQEVAERIRVRVEEEPYEYGSEKMPITISCGVAESESFEQKIQSLFELADKRLYAAKSAGRNRIEPQI